MEASSEIPILPLETGHETAEDQTLTLFKKGRHAHRDSGLFSDATTLSERSFLTMTGAPNPEFNLSLVLHIAVFSMAERRETSDCSEKDE